MQDGDGGHDCERSAGVDPEQPGIGERVPRHPLHDRAGEAEGGADREREDRPRHAQLPDHQVLLEGPVPVQQGIDHAGHGDGLGPDGDREHSSTDDEATQRHQPEGAV